MAPAAGSRFRRQARRTAVAVALAAALSSASIAAVLAAPLSFQVGYSKTIGGQVAGTSFDATVTVRSNATSLIDSTYRGTVRVSSSDPQAILPADHTFSAADAGFWHFTVTMRTAGIQSLTVTEMSGGLPVGITATVPDVTVVAGAAQRLAFVQQPADGTAGVPIARQPIVHVEDSWGNLVSAEPSTLVSLGLVSPTGVSGVLACSGGASISTVNGVAAFSGCSVDRPGNGFSMTASAPARPGWGSAGSASFNVAPTAPLTTHFEFSGVPASVSAGTPTGFILWAADGAGMTDPTYRGTVHLTSTDAHATLPADYTFTAADGGVHSTQLTLATGGAQTVTATDVERPTITGTSTVIAVTGTASPTPSPTPTASPTPGAAIALTTSSRAVTYPSRITISAALAGGGSGRVVAIQRRQVGATAWEEVGSITTDATSSGSLVTTPQRTAEYRAVWAGATDLAAATSGAVRVAVSFRLTVSPAATVRTVSHATRLAWTASVGPATAGVTVRFRVYQMTGDGWRLRATTRVATTAAGRAAFSRTFGTVGRWSVQVTALAGPQNASSAAMRKYVTVR